MAKRKAKRGRRVTAARAAAHRRPAIKTTRTETSTRTVKVAKVRQNPAAAAVERQLQQAGRLFEDFRGKEPRQVDRITVPALPRVLLPLGECLGIMYRTDRDGETENYLHRFKKTARPTLAVTSDGRNLYLLGGAYRVTDRGIVDATTPRKRRP